MIISFCIIYSPQCMIYTPGTYNPSSRGSYAYRGSNRLLIRILDRYTRADFSECVWSAQCQGHLQRQHRTEHRQRLKPSPRIEIKISDSAGIEPGPPRLGGTDYRPRQSDGHNDYLMLTKSEKRKWKLYCNMLIILTKQNAYSSVFRTFGNRFSLSLAEISNYESRSRHGKWAPKLSFERSDNLCRRFEK